MSLADDGRLRVVTLATCLPPLKVVTVTFATGVAFAFLALVLRAGFAVVDLAAVEAVGIREKRVDSSIIHNKKPLDRGLLHNVVKSYQFMNWLCNQAPLVQMN